MDPLMIFLRIVHILARLFWVGGSLFEIFVVVPRALTMPPARQLDVFRIMTSTRENVAYGLAAVLTIGTGVTIALRMRWGNLDTWFTSGWGYAILTAFAATVVYVIVASAILPRPMRRMTELANAVDTREPTHAEAAEIRNRLTHLVQTARWALMPLVIALGAMAAARWL